MESKKKKRKVRDNNDNIIAIDFCCGSGHGFIQHIIDLGCDTLVTGEINYHDHLRCQMNAVRVLSLGHKESEIFILDQIKKRLESSFNSLKCKLII